MSPAPAGSASRSTSAGCRSRRRPFELLGDRRSRELALTGGEDYELLFTFDPRLRAELATALDVDGGLTVLGEVTDRVPPGDARFVEDGQPIEPAERGYVAF